MVISEVFLTRKLSDLVTSQTSRRAPSGGDSCRLPRISRDSLSMFAKLTAAHIREYTRPIVWLASQARLAFDG